MNRKRSLTLSFVAGLIVAGIFVFIWNMTAPKNPTFLPEGSYASQISASPGEPGAPTSDPRKQKVMLLYGKDSDTPYRYELCEQSAVLESGTYAPSETNPNLLIIRLSDQSTAEVLLLKDKAVLSGEKRSLIVFDKTSQAISKIVDGESQAK